MRYSTNQLSGARLIFLLEVNWDGQKWYFSSEPVEYEGVQYIGTLGDFQYNQTSQILGVNVEANSLQVQVAFIGLDMVKEWRKGRILEGSTGTFSYILEKDGQIQDLEKTTLLEGLVQLPIFGDPEEPPELCTFTLERQPYESSREMIPGAQVIDKSTFPNHDQDTAGGKLYPIVFGTPGVTIDDNGDQVFLFCTPAYNVKKYQSHDHRSLFIIAGHEVQAGSVRIRDGANNEATITVQQGFDQKGQVYSYIDLDGSHLMYPGSSSLSTAAQTPKEFWISWMNGGGLSNPYGDGPLTGGADICRWALTKAGIPVDYGAWNNMASILNQYKFDGYINEAVEAWSWVKDNIIPYLPIEITAGAKGIKPVLAQIFANTYTQPIFRIQGGVGFSRISPIQTIEETGDLTNSIQILYAKQGQENKYAMSVKISPTVKEEGDAERSDLFSSISQNRYGLQESTVETDYVYSRNTATRIAAHIIKSKCFPKRIMEFQADIVFGTLEIGDLVHLTDPALYMDNSLCFVISKTWNQTSWIIQLAIVDNPILQERYI